MADFDPSAPASYNSMQQQAGLAPPPYQFSPTIFPGQVSAALAQGGPAGVSFVTQGSAGTSFGAGMFPGQQLQGFTNQAPMFQGPTGVMMPMQAGAAFNPYSGLNPYAGLTARGPYQGPPGLFTPMAPMPPPAYGGQLAQPGFMTPPPAAAQFNTPYMAAIEQQQALNEESYASRFSYGGIGARIGTNLGAGAIGALAGSRFGRVGAAIGGLAGFFGSEAIGAGAFMQNAFMNQIASPFIQQRAMAGSIEEMSQGFINSGPDLHARGRGFTHHAASDVASGLRNLAGSTRFQQETGDRFNQQDLFRITHEAGGAGLMTGVQNPTQMVSRVRDIAKSLSAFMELAQEPDIQRAISTMGQLRASGLNLSETTRAVAQGRQFARMAGTTFSGLMDVGGALGSQTFQSMGLTQGLGLQTGMQNYALARGAQLGGTLNPQLMSLVGGAQGLGNLNNLFSASTLQMSMLAPSVMSASGGVNLGALQNLIGGGTNAFSQTSGATAALQAMTGRQGVGGLGMAIAMQPLMQDTIGRALQAQGPFAQRNFEDRNILNTMRQMGMTGPGGFITMAQTMGMDRNQAIARAQELSDPRYFDRMRDQIETTRRENRRAELDRYEQERPGFFDTLTRLDPTGNILAGRQRAQSIQLGLRHLGHLPLEMGGFHGGFDLQDEYSRRDLDTATTSDLRGTMRSIEAGMSAPRLSRRRRFATDMMLQEAEGNRGLGSLYNLSGGTGVTVTDIGIGLLGRYGRSETPAQIAERESRVQDYQRVGQFAGNILNTSRSAEVAALRTVGRSFGEGEAGSLRQAQFASRALSTLYGQTGGGMSEAGGAALNLGLRGAAQFAMMRVGGPLGLFSPDVGNVVGLGMARGRQLEDAYVQSMQGSGRNEADLRRYFQEHQSEISQQISTQARFMATPEQLSRMRDVSQFGQELPDLNRTGFVASARQLQTNAMGRMFGQEFAGSEGHRAAIRGIFETTSRAGEFGSNAQQRRESRNAIATVAMYKAVIANPRTSPETRQKAEQKLAELYARLQTQFGPERTRDMTNAITQNSGQLIRDIRDNPEQAAAAENFVRTTSGQSAAEILQTVSEARQQGTQAEAAVNVAAGAQFLGRQGGAVGVLFGGMGEFSESRLEDRVGSASEDLLERMARGSDRDKQIARAARLMRSDSDEDKQRGRVLMQQALAGNAGARTRLQREYREGLEFTGGPISDVGVAFRAVRAAIRGPDDMEQYIQEGLQQGTEADETAGTQLGAINSLQSAFRSAFGGGNNELVQASSELREAARALQGAVAGRGLDNLLPENP